MDPPWRTASPPPESHTLRPHHVAILLMIVVYYRGIDFCEEGGTPQQLNPRVKMRMLKVLAREIGEMQEPTPYPRLVEEITSGFNANKSLRAEIALLHHTLSIGPSVVSKPEVLADLFGDVRNLVVLAEEPPDQEPFGIFERRSFIGIFIRRCWLSFKKLSFPGQVRLQADFTEWCNGKLEAGYHVSVREKRLGLQIYPVTFDLHESAQHKPYIMAEQAIKTGDSHVAIDRLRRFYDQRFHVPEENDPTRVPSTLFQDSLLDLAKVHYSRGEFRAARHFLDEAIKICREKNDFVTLDMCRQLMQRINPDPATLYIARDRGASVRAGGSPLDILWEVKRLLDLGEGIQLLFVKVYEALGVWDAKLKSNLGADRFAKHAVMVVLWRLLGVESLADCHEKIIRTFTVAGESDARISALCSAATRLTRGGKSELALKILLDPQTWRGLNFRQYSTWALAIWNVFHLTAQRRGQINLIRNYLDMNRPPSPQDVQSTGPESPFERRSVITESLRLALKYKEAGQAVPAIQPLMDALWSSETRGMYAHYRVGVVLLADVGIEFGLGLKGMVSIEEVLPQILLGDDLELRAYASVTYARCIIAAAGENISEQSLKASRPHLVRAVKDYKTLTMYNKALEALYILATVCHNLRLNAERDSWATQFHSLDEERRKAVEWMPDKQMTDIMEVVVKVAGVVGREVQFN